MIRANRVPSRTLLHSPFGRALSLIMVAFTVIPIVILSALSIYTVQVQLLERSVTQAATVAGLVQQTTTQWIGDASTQLASVLKNAAVVQNSSFILMSAATDVSRAELVLGKDLGTLASGPYFSALFLVRPDDSIALSSQPDLKGQKLQIGLAELSQAGKRVWGFDQLPLTGKPTALVWQPIQDQRQVTIGFLVGQIDIKELSASLQKGAVGLGQTGEIYLVGSDQVPLTDIRLATADTSPKLPFDPIKTGTFSGLFNDYDNRPVVGAVQALKTPLQGWLVVHQQQAEAFDTLYSLIRTALGLLAALVGLAILAAIFASQRIIDPLYRLSGAARSMANGTLSARVDVKRRDEIGVLATSFNSMAAELEGMFNKLEGSNRKLTTRAEQLATITRVSQHATSFLDLADLLPMLTREIQQAFGYYAVALFLPDPQSDALLGKAAAGASASEFVAALTRRDIGSGSLVGTAASLRQIVNVPDVTQDARYVAHPLRPDTRSEISIPLLTGTKLIGVLDIQSNRPDAFGQDEVDILRILANQIAIAIRNADLFHESESARQVADEANRLKSEFLSNMSHELRTPLNVIIGYSHSILNRPAMYDHVPLPSVYESGVRSIMTSGQHLLGLINDILDLSKIEAGQIDLTVEPVDPLPILQGVRSTGLGLIKSNVTLRADYPQKLPEILGDELRIRQILLNLVSNAVKFTQQGFITLDARIQGDRMLFSVADTGSGIPVEAQSHLFERFRQADRDVTRKHGGTGLGLSISRQLCTMHGGDIWFESQVGKGTTFFFTIPLVAQAIREEMPPKPPVALTEISSRAQLFTPAKALTRQALLIDTHSESRSQLRDVLVQAGYDVIPVDDAERGIEMAEAVLPDLIVIHTHKDDPDAMVGLADRCRQHNDLAGLPLVALNDVQDVSDPVLVNRFMNSQAVKA